MRQIIPANQSLQHLKSTRNSQELSKKLPRRLQKIKGSKRKKKRKGVQKKKLIDDLRASNIKTAVEEHVPSKNVVASCWSMIMMK